MSEVEIENGLYEAIRLEIVSRGLLPDITDYIPNDIAGYEARIQEIKGAGNKIIFIENSGSYQQRENLEENCIIIDQEESAPSQTGTSSVYEYTYDGINENYVRETTANGLFDLQYRVTMVCYDSEYIAIMQDILRQALGFRKKINSMDNNANVTGSFWCFHSSYLRLDSSKFIERAVLFDIPSVDLIGNTGGTIVARAEQISIGINTTDIGNDPETEDETTIVVD